MLVHMGDDFNLTHTNSFHGFLGAGKLRAPWGHGWLVWRGHGRVFPRLGLNKALRVMGLPGHHCAQPVVYLPQGELPSPSSTPISRGKPQFLFGKQEKCLWDKRG